MKKIIAFCLVIILMLSVCIASLQGIIAYQSGRIAELEAKAKVLKADNDNLYVAIISRDAELSYYTEMFKEMKNLPRTSYLYHLWNFLHKYHLA